MQAILGSLSRGCARYFLHAAGALRAAGTSRATGASRAAGASRASGFLVAAALTGCMPTGDIDLFPRLPPPRAVRHPVPPPTGEPSTLLEQYAKRKPLTRAVTKWEVFVVGARDRSEASIARLADGLAATKPAPTPDDPAVHIYTETPLGEIRTALESGTLQLSIHGKQARAQADSLAKELGQMGALVDVRPGDGQPWLLPDRSKGVIAALLIATALDRVDELEHLFSKNATWGMPDRRRINARPVFNGDNGEAFLAEFRELGTRFSAKASFKSAAVPNGIEAAYRSGAEPMWVSWVNDDEQFIAALRLIDGVARIEYVGFSTDGSYFDVDSSGSGPMPPAKPPAKPNRGQGRSARPTP